MKKKALIALLFVLLIFMPLLAGCATEAKETSKEEKIVITDALGRSVELPKSAETAVAIGPGALRLYVYVADKEKLAGVEETEKTGSTQTATAKTYFMANPDLANLPTVGLGGPNNAPDPEKLLAVNPDVIFTTYASDVAVVDELQSKTGIPVVALSYGKEGIFDEMLYQSLNLIGEVMGDTDRSEEIVQYIKDAKIDLNKRSEKVDATARPTVYAGAISSAGAHGIESTRGQYALFTVVNANNVVDQTGKVGGLMIDKEKLIEWNPNLIFLDYGGLSLVKEDITTNPEYYETLSAFKNNNVYMTLPYNSYSTNVDTAIADCYYIGSVLYPDAFKDVDPVKKAGEIYETFIGTNVYDQMVKNYGAFQKMPK